MKKFSMLIAGLSMLALVNAQQKVVFDFEDGSGIGWGYSFATWSGTVDITDNPDKSGINTSNKVCHWAPDPATVGGGWKSAAMISDMNADLSQFKAMKLMYYAKDTADVIFIEVKSKAGNNALFSKWIQPGEINKWTEVSFDLSSHIDTSAIEQVYVWFNPNNTRKIDGYIDNLVFLYKEPKGTAGATKVNSAIKVDGMLDEAAWALATKYSIDSVYKGESIKDANDLSAYFQTLWADSGIFVAVTVTDDIRGTMKTGFGPTWAQDLVEVYFDMNTLNFKDGIGSGGNNGHYGFAANQSFAGTDSIMSGAGTREAYHRTGDNASYIKELFVPWANLKDIDGKVYKPNANIPIGFDICLVDNDQDAADAGRNYRNRKVWSNYGVVNENYSNMDDAGRLIFPEASAEMIKPAAMPKKETKAVVVDGMLTDADWNKATKYPVLKVFKGEEIKGDAVDLSSYFQTIWADSGMFVAVTVTDDIRGTNKAGYGPSWNQDLVEIYFDMNPASLKDGKGSGANVGHYGFSANQSFVGTDSIMSGAGTREAYHRTGVGANYIKELFVPWTNLKDVNGATYTPNSTVSFGFDVCIIDNDMDIADTAKGKNYRNRMVWSNDGQINENYANMDDAGLITLSGAPVAPVVTAVQTKAAIVVDGKLTDADWKTAVKVPLNKVFNGESIKGGSADCSGYFQTLWSDTGVFVAVTVMDDVKGVSKSGFGPSWNQDLVEVYFDMNVGNLKDGVGASSNKGHYQNAGNCPAGTDTIVQNSGSITAYHYGTKANYTKEVYIPWTNLKDSAGNLFTDNKLPVGFDVYVIDNDKDSLDKGLNFRNRLVWSNSGTITEDWSNLNDAGRLIFSGIPVYSSVASINVAGNLSFYPNPANESITLRTNNSKLLPVTIYNLTGQVVLSQSVANNSKMNISKIKQGVYFVKMSDGSKIYTGKLIKK